jgi:hypothetical protein
MNIEQMTEALTQPAMRKSSRKAKEPAVVKPDPALEVALRNMERPSTMECVAYLWVSEFLGIMFAQSDEALMEQIGSEMRRQYGKSCVIDHNGKVFVGGHPGFGPSDFLECDGSVRDRFKLALAEVAA